jgi:hypothetical protein
LGILKTKTEKERRSFPQPHPCKKGKRGSWGVLKTKTREGTPELPTTSSLQEGEKGELGRPEDQNERRNAGASHNLIPARRGKGGDVAL